MTDAHADSADETRSNAVADGPVGDGHGITCACGQTFQTTDALERHIEDEMVISTVLDEIKRIGGEKFHRVARYFEQDAHSGDIRELAATEDIALTAENATELAKQELVHLITRYDEYESTIDHVMEHMREVEA